MSQSAPGAPPPASRPGGRGLAFRAKLIVAVCGLVLLTGAVVLWLAHRSARQSTESLTGSVFREVSGRAASHTRGFVHRAAPVVASLARLADHGLVVDDPDRLAPQLLAVLEANPGLSWVSYADESGRFTGVYRTPEGKFRVNRSRIVAGKTQLVEHDVQPDGTWTVFKSDPDSGYDPRVRPFYVRAKQAGRLVWLPPYVFYWQWVPGITCASPVKDLSGMVRGVLTADFDLNALSGFVGGLSVSEHSSVFLFTSDKVLLAHPSHRVTSGTEESARLLTLADAGDPLVDAFHANLRPEHLSAVDGDGFHFFEFQHDGTEYLGSTTAFKVGDDLVWVVGVAAPKADFVGDVWRTQALALAAAGAALLAAMLLAFVLASAVSRPVEALTRFVRKVGEGDLEARADIGGGPEFRELSDALNRMIADLRDRLRLRHSLDLAMQVQKQLLPQKPPTVPGLDVAGHSTYCDETGGDYYDFLVLDEVAGGGTMIALGDVMGHGVAAALVMAGARAVLRDRAAEPGGLAGLMGRLNNMLAADLEGSRFMTMHLAVVDARSRTYRWASAGHDPAFILDPAEDRFIEDASGGPPLGVMADLPFEEYTFAPLMPGQVIVVGTDGVWEMPNEAGDQYGKDRLREVIRTSSTRPASEIAAAILDSLMKYRGACRPADDVTFVVVKVVDLPESR